MVQSIIHMTPADQEKYRNDPEFRKKVDDKVAGMGYAGDPFDYDYAKEAALHVLKCVRDGKPTDDLITKMYVHGDARYNKEIKIPYGKLDFIADEAIGNRAAPLVRDIQEAFRKDPGLRGRLQNPETDEDKEFAREFNEAAKKVINDQDEYDKYIKPLLEKGELPLEVQLELNDQAFSNDMKGTIDDILHRSPEDRQKIIGNPDKYLSYLSDDDKELAVAVARQAQLIPADLANATPDERHKDLAKIKTDEAYRNEILSNLRPEQQVQAVRLLEYGPVLPEDQIRMQMNHWGGSSEIMATLNEMKAKGDYSAIAEMKNAYARKYGYSLEGELIDKLDDATEKAQAHDILLPPAGTSDEQYLRDLNKYLNTYDGAGKNLVNAIWDGTGFMSENSMNRYTATMSDFSARFKQLPPDMQKELKENLEASLAMFRESKQGAASAAFDVIIAAVAVAGAVFTDGLSLGLLAGTAAGGAALQVIIKSVIMGGDYEWEFGNVTKDAVMGAVNGGLNCVAPGEIAALAGVGKAAAAEAAEKVMIKGGEKLLGEAGEALLKKELGTAMTKAISDGSFEISSKQLDDIVKKVAKERSEE